MKYFKNTELAKLYNVSEKSVRNWIQAALDQKLNLQVIQYNDRHYIADTVKNTALIEQLVIKGKKYKNNRSHKVIMPDQAFYELYSPAQIIDIISNIDIYREIPRQYNYFDQGAEYWDKYTVRLKSEATQNILTCTLDLLDLNWPYLEDILKSYTRVNVIDIGVGNGLPIRSVLERILNAGKLGRYVALDISSEMLNIAQNNMQKWFGKNFPFEAHELDINYDRFTGIIANETTRPESETTINLVFVLGGTLGNLRSPDGAFKVIHDSMGKNDILIQTLKLDTPVTRRYFDFSIGTIVQPLAPQYKFIVDLLGIDESYYTVEMGYDQDTNERYLKIKLKVSLSIHFSFNEGKKVLELNKDDTILMWRYWHKTALEITKQLDENEFYVLQASLTESKDYLLSMSRIKR